MKSLILPAEAVESSPFNGLELIEAKLKEMIDTDQGAVRDICLHILNAGGKRVRPLLVLHSGLLFNPISEQLIKTAVAVELIHMASLIHDDLIDNSAFRRSQPTVQTIWGNHHAVLAGDFLFAKAFGTLAKNNLVKPLQIMAESVKTMCQGEIDQDKDQFDSKTSLEKYYDRITKKTAVLFEASCRTGAWAGGANEQEVAAISRFGLNLGMAYQMVDDILDICGDEAKMGKPKYTDLIRGNMTLPLILLLQRDKHSSLVKDILENPKPTPENLSQIELMIKTSGIIEQAGTIVRSHLNSARNELRQLPESSGRQFLEKLTLKLQARTN